MELKAGNYIFECDLMPWTVYELGETEASSVAVSIELSDEDIHNLVSMMHWAWKNDWFEHSISETVCTELLQKHNPMLYEKVYQEAHHQFCLMYPNCEIVDGWGVYEVFPPDDIVEYAKTCYLDP